MDIDDSTSRSSRAEAVNSGQGRHTDRRRLPAPSYRPVGLGLAVQGGARASCESAERPLHCLPDLSLAVQLTVLNLLFRV